MIPNPIHKVLSTLRSHEVKYLLMGGQACVFYGAAEFSRDTDIALPASHENLDRLKRALRALDAEVIAVPPLDLVYLERGHAVHFRCRHPEAEGIRLDVMSSMRGLPEFLALWERRTSAELDGCVVDILSLPDLVAAKKTQWDKDWPMIRRLVEAHYFNFQDQENAVRIHFWLAECRTPELLRELGWRFIRVGAGIPASRPFLSQLEELTDEDIESQLAEEEQRERMADKAYWKPLRDELERLRHRRRNDGLRD